MIENYENKLLAIVTLPSESVHSTYPSSKLMIYGSIRDNEEFEKTLRSLAEKLPFSTDNWPSFGAYVEDWFNVEVTQFSYNIYYCERGVSNLRETCSNFFDAAFEVFRIVVPQFSKAASTIATNLDRIADQRLLIWLRMSSEIYQMYQINELFGRRVAVYNVMWMCEELVRMGVAENPSAAFRKKTHIEKGLTLSGYSIEQANEIYKRIKREQ